MITKPQMPRIAAWVVPFAVGLLLAGNVRAQSTNRPWTKGVSQEQQIRAKMLYEVGNHFLANSIFAEAVTAYRGALQYWDHPGIHYNLALALISLDRPIEAYEAIMAALRYGPDALQPDEYRRAHDYKSLLLKQLVEIEIDCAQPGVAVSLDGKPLFTGPGRVTIAVWPGKHEIVASKAGHITLRKTIMPAAAERMFIALHLIAKRTRLLSQRLLPTPASAPASSPGPAMLATRASTHPGSISRNYGAGTALLDGAVAGLVLIPVALKGDDDAALIASLLYVFSGQVTHSFRGNFGTGWLSSLNRVAMPAIGAAIGYSLSSDDCRGCAGGAALGVAAALGLDWFVLSRDRVKVEESSSPFWPALSPTHGGLVAGIANKF